MSKVTAKDVEICVAQHFGYHRNFIVPNISWGMGLLYEADVVVLRPSGYAVEVEIKVSASDIKADLKKKYQHDSNLFCELWFAVPEALTEHPDIPARAGILSVYAHPKYPAKLRTKVLRKPERNKLAEKWTQEQRSKFYYLAYLRIWPLKKILQRLESSNPPPD